jgi:hypothetical protein
MPLPKRRSSISSSFRRTPSGRDRLPPPTTGATNRWHSSTNPALNAWEARSHQREPIFLRPTPTSQFATCLQETP